MKFSVATLILAVGFAAAAPAADAGVPLPLVERAEDAVAPLAERATCGSTGYCSGGYCQIYVCSARGCYGQPTNVRC
ncbi:hypothetical protein CMUS01_02809 [Colletotrichum musicola]|uniref:Uncharacterized protein n=1 Tax=Colletotrichum musicola TaxID=2175873 RepID=A0A8H6NUK4_9PEZI|nr:hypothetical protein CMUS01_02809 [Colletotrichum musicola]